ncbi:MAG: hypothetical protein JWN79_3240 [Gemmatimonadetes bacterium]|jgi:hypothetical protein|nr:hypothetical protein [Gemmatimonadota bacterium]
MPVVSFETLPDASRVWIFGSDRPLTEAGTAALLKGVDEHLANWKAHGEPLTVGSQFRDNRFLVVAVDQSTAGATGCSIDGLFRVLQGLEGTVGANLVGGGRVFYRGAESVVQSTTRDQVPALVQSEAITKNTVVFDTSITDLGKFRSGFEKRAKESWIAELAGFGEQ